MGFSLHADAQNQEGGKVAWRERVERKSGASVCLCACGRAGQSEELLLAVPFKSDLVAVSVITYCRTAVQSLSKSSDLHPHEKTE